MKKLLIFAWEYNGYHSVQGTALARRITQVAEAFNSAGWKVTVIHKDQRNEGKGKPWQDNIEKNGIRRIAVTQQKEVDFLSKNVIARKLDTWYNIAFHGDRSFYWAKYVIENFDKLNIEKPDYILAFYTPRVPLFLGNYFAGKLQVPWVADIQDPVFAGIARKSVFFSRIWMKRILKTAQSIVHVSPEWAESDGIAIGKNFAMIRHALPAVNEKIESGFVHEFRKQYGNGFNIFYGGSISTGIQSLELLKKVLQFASDRNMSVRLLLAGNENAYKIFRDALGDKVVHLGWLTPVQMNEYIYCCDCNLVIPWSKERIGIPSKFYEFCSFKKPIWIIGNDIGGFRSLLNEWQHPPIPVDDLEYQQNALLAATRHDFSKMFNMENCKGRVVTVKDLYQEYVKLF